MLDATLSPFANLAFVVFDADMIYPLGLTIPVGLAVLASDRLRSALRSFATLSAFLATALLWIGLIPWSAAFLTAMLDAAHPNPEWAFWPILAVFFVWPIAAATLIGRARNARFVSILYVAANVPGWLLGCIVSTRAVSGAWT